MVVREKIEEKVHQLDKEFDQVIILEKLEEGLVLLADNLCWNLEQVRGLELNGRKKEFESRMTTETRQILAGWLWADFILYKHFLARHEKSVEAAGGVGIVQGKVSRLTQM